LKFRKGKPPKLVGSNYGNPENALPGPFPPLRGCFGKLFVHEFLGGFLFVHCRKLLGGEDAVDVQNHDELGIALSPPLMKSVQ
jgi:hypothetical protein